MTEPKGAAPSAVPMVIESTRSVWWTAELRDTDAGVAVDIYARLPGNGMRKLCEKRVIDAPWHVVCDRIFELLNQLDSPRVSQGARRRRR